MSAETSPSPPQGPTNPQQLDESKMPKGHCRYILLLPEIKGQRCACVNFTLNKGIPGATCDCGHLACFHKPEPEPSANDMLKELESLKRRVKELEGQAAGQDEEVVERLGTRLTEVQESLEKSKEEVQEEFRRSFAHVSMSWNTMGQMGEKMKQQDDQIQQIYEKLRSHEREFKELHDRDKELDEANLTLEERVEELEALEEDGHILQRGRDGRPRRRSTSDTTRPNFPLGPLGGAHLDRVPLDRSFIQGRGDISGAIGGTPSQQALSLRVPTHRFTVTWTIHISLLPQASIAMPFERNTNAYQRCLSRGLHQVVAIAGPTHEAFVTAVTKAFGGLLKDRPWMPLQAKVCDAEPLRGLPMLRQLDNHLDKGAYDAEFLRNHCAVCDDHGAMDSLYIAMREPHKLTWHGLKRSPTFMSGLEDSWAIDPLLDGETPLDDDDSAVEEEDRPAIGDIVGLQTLKRGVSEISRSNSFGASSSPVHEDDGSQPKRTRPHPVDWRRGVEA